MKLDKKKQLAARVLKVGKRRIIFDNAHLNDIKEAITKQDIRDLHSSGVIKIREEKGKRKKRKRRTKKRAGKRKKNINRRKQEYVKITRKLRAYVLELKNQKKINVEEYKKLRNKIRARTFRSKSHLKEHLLESLGIK